MKNQRKIDLIVVHCSATRINQDFPVEALEACHKGISPIQRPHYITSSYTYQFFEKSYFIIVFRVKDC